MKCLLVEDHDDVRRLIAELIGERGHEVEGYAAGEPAFGAYLDSFHELVFLDLNLPDGDGLDICRRIRSHPRGAHTVVVVLTGRGGPEDVARALDAGADDFISKPVLSRDFRVRLTIAERQAVVRGDRARAEHERNTLNAVLEAAVEGVVRVGLDGRIVEVNETYARMLGHRAEDLLERGAELGVIDDDLALVAQAADSMLLAGWSEAEVRAHRPDGSLVHLGLTFVPVWDRGGEASGHYRIVKDITERKIAEERIWRDSAFLRSVVENIPDMIFVKDARELRFVRFNRAGEELLGFRREDLLGKNDYDLFPTEEADFFTAKDREVLTGRRVVDIPEEPIHTRSYGARTLHTKKIPILDEDGVPQYLLGISEDVTERKRAESALLAASRLEATATLAGGVAHDFNNLMAVVLSTTDLLRDVVSGDVTGNELIDEIAALARKGGGLARQMLAFARGGTTQLEVVDLNAVVREIVGLQFRAPPPGVRIEQRLAVDLWPIAADPTQMGQVVMNLCTNGVEALEGAGRLRIETRNRELDLAQALEAELAEGPYVELVVEDSGGGLDEETRAHVFEPFFTTKFQGRGLGLSVVYGIVRALGGNILVESAPGRGSQFRVLVPAQLDEAG
ncbi:MAG: PAS domain S-box protein [Deltaproteobacteria bacterium]|jgi:two-component system cell cycle sensor histidine kinase/response regulator CckA|nr:PAS domain S-box protein [Deltaproteobacteria bacterium]